MGIDIVIIGLFIFMAFSLFMNRNANKKAQDRRHALVEKMQAGDWIYTTSGFYGKFVEMDGQVVVLENEEGHESYWSLDAVLEIKDPPFAESDEGTEHSTPSADIAEASNSGMENLELEKNLENTESGFPQESSATKN